MSKRVQVKVYTREDVLRENLARVHSMSAGECRQRVKQLRADLAHARRSQRRSLSGGIKRRYLRRDPFLAPPSRLSASHQKDKEDIEREIAALESRLESQRRRESKR